MPHLARYQLLDYSNERSNTTVNVGAITAVSIAGFLTAFGALRTAIEGITLGVVSQESWVGDITALSNTPPTDAEAQREKKWLVRYTGDTTDKVYTLEIATAELSGGHLLPMSDFADLEETDMAAFVTAFEAIARTPDDDEETVTVQSIQYVGRNL
jgi:hypothetical protein